MTPLCRLVTLREITEPVWSVIGPFIKGATDRSGGRYTLDDVRKEIVSGNQKVFVAFDANTNPIGVVTAFVNDYPSCRFLTLAFCGGVDLASWMKPMLQTLYGYAIAIGAIDHASGNPRVEFVGRPGWSRTLKAEGWDIAFNHYEYAPSGGQQ